MDIRGYINGYPGVDMRLRLYFGYIYGYFYFI